MPRWLKVALGTVAAALVLVVVALLLLTQTDPGRRQVRSILLARLQSSAHGIVRMGPVHGNLLTGARIDGLVITDSTGAPFFRADTITLRYSLLAALLQKRIDVANVRMVRPVVVLDRRPGLAWNFSRIFPSDTTKPPTRQGFGAWINVRNLSVVGGRVTVRDEWAPPDSLAPAARALAVREALSRDSRLLVVRVPGGFQSVQDYQRINGRFDRLRLAHPDSAAMVFDVAGINMLALPFRPPAAIVRNLSGRVIQAGDTLVAESLKVAFPGSRVVLDGVYVPRFGEAQARVVAAPLALPDLRWAYPALPAGGGSLDVAVARRGSRTRVVARRLDLAAEGARVAGAFDVAFGDSLRLGSSDLRFSGVDTRLIERLLPDVDPPRQGVLAGRLALAGTPAALQVDGNVSFADRGGGVSRVVADGEVGTTDEFRARGLRLRFAPLQISLLGAAGADIPVGGVITGDATLTGSASRGFDFRSDLVHSDRSVGRSHVTAAGAILRRGESFAARDLRLRLDPLQVAVARAFKPDLPLGGTLTGTATLNGTTEDLRLATDLVHRSAETGESRISARGGLALGEELRARDLRLRLAPLSMGLVRAFQPELELGGAVAGTATLSGTMADLRLAADLEHRSAETGRSRLVARGGVGLGEVFRARDLHLRFAPLEMTLVRAFRPDLALSGTLTGTTTLNGTPADLRLAADLEHRSAETGRSHVVARGGVGLGETFRARDLRLRFDPLQTALVRMFQPDLPLSGLLAGQATLNGSTAGRMSVTGDVRHDAPTGVSRLVGSAAVPMGGSGSFAVDVRALPLSLATAGRFAPGAGLRGSASGRIRLNGTMRDLALSLGLAVENGGTVDASGRLSLGGSQPRYDLQARFGAFNAGAVTTRAPSTALTGTASAVGRGTDPATMAATVAADLRGARVGSTGVDSVRVLARIADGLAAVERGTVHLASARADASGSFGLVAGRSGTLSYHVRVDTLSHFSGLAPGDSGRVAPRPALVAQAVQRAREDSARIARATEVERAATGLPPEPPLRVDSVRPLRRDSLSGSLDARGEIAGNVTRFDARGEATMRDLVAMGTSIGSGAVSYTWLNAPTASSDLSFHAQLESVQAGGFALDSVDARVRYAGGRGTGSGTLDLAVRQDPRRDYRAQAEFTLSPQRREVRYSDLSLRFDTTVWRAPRPGAVSLAGGGVELRDVELLANDGGRVFADGRLPVEGPANLRVEVDRLEIGDVVALLQDSVRVRGRLSLAADVRGTGASPVIEGTGALVGAVVDTVRVPDVDARFAYADRLLRGDARIASGGTTLATAEGRLPINLAVSGVTGPRLAADAPLELDVRADSLPLEALPSFTTAVSDVRGRVVGTVAVRGTLRSPDLRGVVDLDLASLRVEQPGLALEEVAGTVRLAGDSAVVDSLTARSGGGTVRVAGGLDFRTLTEPGFDLRLGASDARVLNNELGRVKADADLTLTGPWNGARVAGTLRLTEGVIYAPEPEDLQRIDIDNAAVAALGDTAAVKVLATNPLLGNLRVDVEVAILPDTWVRNTQANIEIFTPRDVGPLRVSMNRATQSLVLNGTIHTERGEYTFAGRRIRLTQGAAIFRGETPIDPILQITAEQEVRLPNRPAFAIQLLVGGTMLAPRLTVESNAQPPIAESDLLSYFAFGQSSSSLLQPETGSSLGGGAGGGGELLGPIGALATQQLGATAVGTLVDQLELQTRRSLKLDVFNITPAPLPPEFAVQPEGYLNVFRGAQYEAGRYLTNRWFLAAQGRTSAVLPGMLLEYRTRSGFQWVTSWEPRFQPQQPSLEISQTPATERVLGLFLQWQRRF